MLDFIEYYKNKGHVFGECMSKSDTDLMYINIPKNASSWVKLVLGQQGWEFYNYHTDNLNKQPVVVLRDPVDRWLSGIAEYMYLYHRNIDTVDLPKSFFDLVFGQVAFDDHTERQILFLQNIDLDSCIFFKFDQNFKTDFLNFLNTHTDIKEQHITKNSPERLKFYNIFRQQLDANSKYKQQIEAYFEKDHSLINSVTFYEAR